VCRHAIIAAFIRFPALRCCFLCLGASLSSGRKTQNPRRTRLPFLVTFASGGKVIQRLSHITLLVEDQGAAKEFYTEVLGFDLRSDQSMGHWRWVTVSPKGQPDLEIVLMPVAAAQWNDAYRRA
jgi:hypothetical protein